jgi:hypothetical protein
MTILDIVTQIEYEAYVMDKSDYKEGHPTYHPMIQSLEKGYSLVAKNLSSYQEDSIIWEGRANNYVLKNATKEEKEKLIKSGYQMIGLK